jgi:uncharacterized membrane protein
MSYPTTRNESFMSFEQGPTTEVIVRAPNTASRSSNGETSGRDGAHSLARALGWFSIGLGLTEVLMPRKLGRVVGVGEDHSALFPLLGLREIASGVGVLAAKDPTLGVRARVAGDMLDLALLGTALTLPDNERGRVAAATAAVVGVTALDILCAAQLPAEGSGQPRRRRQVTAKATAGRFRASVAINRPVAELYAYWRDIGNLPRVMQHLESVREIGERRSHWVAKGPAGATLEWDAEVTHTSNQSIAWRSLPDSDVPTEGTVTFKPLQAGRGTIVTVDVDYQARGPIAGRIASLVGKTFEQHLQNDLRRWKQLIETGEIATTEGQPSGKRSLISRHLP